jgi:hypothetical protein
MTLRYWLSASTAPGIAAALGLVLCALALQDIARGETDLRNEWWAVRLGLVMMSLFTAAALVTLAKLRCSARGY